MELSESAKKTLWEIFNSYISAYGTDLDDLFEQYPDYREIHEKMEKEIVNEATDDSRAERISRKFRMTRKHRHRDDKKNKTSPNPNFADRTSPRKTGEYRPDRGGNRIHNKPLDIAEGLIPSLCFIRDHLKIIGQPLHEAVCGFEDKATLYKLVSHLVATRLGGWREEGDMFINESGHMAYKDNWSLDATGRLCSTTRQPVSYNIDWLLEVRQYCDEARS